MRTGTGGSVAVLLALSEMGGVKRILAEGSSHEAGRRFCYVRSLYSERCGGIITPHMRGSAFL